MEKQLSQKQRIFNLLSDGQLHSVDEIIKNVYGLNHAGICCIHSRITELRAEGKKSGKFDVPNAKFFDHHPKMACYQIVFNNPPVEVSKKPQNSDLSPVKGDSGNLCQTELFAPQKPVFEYD
jgi:hypothetical protein